MISPDLDALGFDYPEWSDMVNDLFSRPMKVIENVGPYAVVARHRDRLGCGVGMSQDRHGYWTSVPSLRAGETHRAEVRLITSTLALVDLYDNDDAPGELTNRILVTVDDPHIYELPENTLLGKPFVSSEYQISAVALNVEVFESVEAWKKFQTPIHVEQHEIFGGAHDFFMGPNFLFSNGLYELFGPEPEDNQLVLDPSTHLVATVDRLRLATNHVTLKPWYRVEVQSSFQLTIALPASTLPKPLPGSVIQGDVLLLGSSGFWDQ